MSPRTLISVLLPVRDAMPYLTATLDDLRAQQGVEFEVVVVDDGSTDGSLGRLERIASEDRRFQIRSGPARGAAAALNRALGAARGSWIAQMEADDRIPPHRLARLAAALDAERDWDGVVSQVQLIGAARPGMRRYVDWQNGLATPGQMARARFVEIPALHQTGLYRRRLFDRLGGFREPGWPLDIDFWMRTYQAGRIVGKCPEVLYCWRQHPAQTTRRSPRHTLAALRRCKAIAFVRGPGRGRPIDLIGTGETLEAWARALIWAGAEGIDARAWRPGVEPLPPRRPNAVRLFVYGMQKVRAKVQEAAADFDSDHDWFAA
jgi:glycosyltransferase involved in cell wall biosynthesis